MTPFLHVSTSPSLVNCIQVKNLWSIDRSCALSTAALSARIAVSCSLLAKLRCSTVDSRIDRAFRCITIMRRSTCAISDSRASSCTSGWWRVLSGSVDGGISYRNIV